MKGFSFFYGQKTVFVETIREYKTKSLATNILKEMKIPEDKVDALLYRLQKTDCEFRQTSNGFKYYSMSGKSFSECGPMEALIHIHVI